MRTPGLRQRPIRALAGFGLLALVAGLVLGVLGMHTLMPPSDGHATTTTAGAAGPSHGDHAGTVAVTTMTEEMTATPPAPLAQDNSGDHGLGHLMMLCTSLLVAAMAGALLYVLLIARQRPHELLGAVRSAATFRHLSRPGAGPPYVWRYSVIRC